jgi:4-hydroxyphenylacetate 3-monooxygenase
MVKTLGSENINQVQTLVAELIEDLEIMKALLLASESEAALDSWGVMCPSRVPITVARNQFIRMYPRMIEIIQLLGSSSLMALPTESDLNGPLSDYVNRYMDTDNSSAKERIELFRLAWDLSCSAFGSRQVLYERYFQGDWMRNASVLFGTYSTDKFVEQVKEFLRTD